MQPLNHRDGKRDLKACQAAPDHQVHYDISELQSINKRFLVATQQTTWCGLQHSMDPS
jgi:hypothetical protein